MSPGEDSAFLSDRPIDTEAADQFGHLEYVDSLETMVQAVDPPWHIGIFGEWGSGKTSIIRLLFQRIQEQSAFDDVVAVEFDAWSHAEGSVRTELLLELDQKIGELVNPSKGYVLGEDEITGRLYDVQEEEQIQEPGSYREQAREFAGQNPFLVGAFVILLLSAGGLYAVGEVSWAQLVATGLLLPVLGYIVKQLDTVTQTIQRTYLHPRKEWSGAYERIFDSIIDRSDAEKIVISIDNLDRCESETVYDVLVSLKTFMEQDKCIYLIPCDDEALVNHISSIEDENEREFLRKFFQAHIRIPPKLAEDIEAYAASENEKLSEALEPETVDVITNAYIDNPRRIKHAINRVVTLRLLGTEIEETDSVSEGRLTAEEPFLAKISILEEEFSEFFDIISADPDLLNDITDFYNNDLEAEDRVQRVKAVLDMYESEGESRLEAFLRSTRRISVKDPQRFLYLTEPSYSTGVENVDEFLDNLKTGRASDVRDELEKIQERQQSITPYLSAIRRNLEKYHQSGRDQPFYGIIDTTIGIFDTLVESSQEQVAAFVGEYLTTDLGRSLLPQLDPEAVFDVIVQMEAQNKRELLEEYTTLVRTDEKLEQSVLQAFVTHADEIPPGTVDRLSANLAKVGDGDLEQVLDLLDTNIARTYLITPQILDLAISLTELDEGANTFANTDYYTRFDAEAGQPERGNFVGHLLELRSDYNGGNPDQVNQALADELLGIEPAIPAPTSNDLFAVIRDLVNESNQEAVYLVEVCFYFFGSFTDETREAFYTWLANLFQQLSPPQIQKLFSLSDEHDVPLMETDDEISNLYNRIPNNINEQDFISNQVVPETPTEYDDQLQETVIDLLRNNDFNIASIGLTILEAHPDRFEAIRDEVVDTCGTQARQANNVDHKRAYLEVGADAFVSLDGPAQEDYISHLESLLNGNANQWELYRELWEQIEPDADRDRREAVAGDVREKVAEELSQGQNPDHLTPLIAVLQTVSEQIGSQNGSRLMERLSDRLTDNLNANQQAVVIEQLAGFDQFYEKGDQIVDRVENVLGKTNHDQVRTNAQALFGALFDADEIDKDRLTELEETHAPE